MNDGDDGDGDGDDDNDEDDDGDDDDGSLQAAAQTGAFCHAWGSHAATGSKRRTWRSVEVDRT